MAFHPSTCPYCSCGCALLLHEERGRLLGSYPRDEPPGPHSLCIRGWNCTSSQSHPDRLATALVRGSRGLEPVSPEQAVDEVAARLRVARAGLLVAAGPTLSNEDAMALRRLAEVLGGRLCTTDLSGAGAARLALRRVLGVGYGLGDVEAVAAADLVWVFGADAGECPQVASSVLAARRAGAVVVRFDVHTAAADGARVIHVPPGALGRLAACFQRQIFLGDLAVAEAREAPGFSALATYWGSVPPEDQPPVIPDADALALVRSFRHAQRPVAVLGSRWLTSARAEEDTVQLLQALALIGGGRRVVMAVGEANSWGCLDVIGEHSSPAELACRCEGIDTLVVAGDDLLRRSPRPATLAETLARLRTVVVIDRFASDTMAFAQVVLPSCVFAEIDGTAASVFGRAGRWRRAVPPPGHARSEREWIGEVMKRMGVAEESPVPVPQVSADRVRLGFCPPAAADGQSPAFPEPGFPGELVLGAQPAAWSTGALSGREELLAREAREPLLVASPAALEQAGLKPGWQARVLVPGGEAKVTVRGDARLPAGVMVLLPLPGTQSSSLRGYYPGAGHRTLGLQPVPARLERV